LLTETSKSTSSTIPFKADLPPTPPPDYPRARDAITLTAFAAKINDAVRRKQEELQLGGDGDNTAAEEDALGALAGCQPDHLQIAM